MNWRGITATIAVATSVLVAASGEGYAQSNPDRNTGRSGGVISGQVTVGGEVNQKSAQSGQTQQPSGMNLGGPVIQGGSMGDVQGERPETLDYGALAPPSRVFKVAVGRGREFNVGLAVDEVVLGEPSLIEYKILESGRVFLFGRSVGSTNIYMLSQGRVVYKGDLFVTIDPSEVQAAIRRLIPTEPIKVEAERNTIFLSGNVRSASAAANAVAIAGRFVPEEANVVNLMKINAKQQVVMRVKVAEVRRSVIKEVEGYFRKLINLTGSLDSITREDNLLRLNYGESNLENSGNLTRMGRLVLQAGSGSILEQFLQMVELTGTASDGVVKTLAEPTLTAISGETATLLSGGEYPVPTSFDAATGVVSYEFRDFGVSLAFTPVVNSKRQINLQIATEISSLGDEFNLGGDLVARGRNINRATTTVDLPSGGSIMIAGLLQQSSSNNIAGTPGMMNVPIIGQAFRQSGREQAETELMLIVTAYIAQPVATQDRLASPTDGYEEANDIDMFFLSKMHKEYSKKKDLAPWAATLKGPYGYVLE